MPAALHVSLQNRGKRPMPFGAAGLEPPAFQTFDPTPGSCPRLHRRQPCGLPFMLRQLAGLVRQPAAYCRVSSILGRRGFTTCDCMDKEVLSLRLDHPFPEPL